MKITHKLAQDIVDKTMSILGKNINIMDEKGVIIGSGDKSRLNQYHEGAAQVIKEGKKLEIYSKDINHLVGARPGINLPIEDNNKIIGVVGITGEPNEVSPFGEVNKDDRRNDAAAGIFIKRNTIRTTGSGKFYSRFNLRKNWK